MSKNLMDTEIGGEQTQYEGSHTEINPHKKSSGQLGNIETTTDPSQTDAAAKEMAERGQKTAENIRYGQTISEGGVSGFTKGQDGVADKVVEEGDGVRERVAAGYGEGKDMDRGVGG